MCNYEKKTGKMQTILEAKLIKSKWNFLSREDGKRNGAVYVALLLNTNLQEADY